MSEDFTGLCAIDTETTGLQPYRNEIIELSIIPLTRDFAPHPTIPEFNTPVRPENIEHIEDRALEINGKTREQCADFPERIETVREFKAWYDAYVMEAHLKNIIPLGHNYGAFDKNFLSAWLDPKEKFTNAYGAFFHYHYHDSMIACMFMNSRQQAKTGQPVFRSVSLTAVCKRLNIVQENAHTARGDALASAAVMNKLCNL